MFYTYAYFSLSGKPYYVGKGQGRRAYWEGGRCCHTPKDKSKIIILKWFDCEYDAYKHECYMIAVLGRRTHGGLLMNQTDGGEGASGRTPWNKGRSWSQAHRDKVTGTGNGKSKHWRLQFADGRVITLCGVTNWCRDNGYDKGAVNKLAQKKRKRHKDIVCVDYVAS